MKRKKRAGWGCKSMALVLATAVLSAGGPAVAAGGKGHGDNRRWIGTWAAAPQPALPGIPQSFRNQTLRLIVHASAGGTKVRIRISNVYADRPLRIGAAHIARRTAAAEIDPASDRALRFDGQPSTTVPPGSLVVSDPIELEVPALSDLAISLFLPGTTAATTVHILAQQTSYASAEDGDHTAAVNFPVAKAIHSWPFLTGVDVATSPAGETIVAFGSSLTDGDGSTSDANHRWPDVLAERLQKAGGGKAEVGVLNEGIIGNRLLKDSPRRSPFGAALGRAGLARFDRDVLAQAGVKYVIVGIGINDIIFPGSFEPGAKNVTAQSIISGYRQLIARAHQKGIRVIGTTNPPFENATFTDPPVSHLYSPAKETVRQQVNSWILHGGAFDAVVDLDAVLRDPSHPTRLLPAYDSGDHLHPNDAGCTAEGNAIPLWLFESH
jgi:lysophospholipase L1-like esterase